MLTVRFSDDDTWSQDCSLLYGHVFFMALYPLCPCIPFCPVSHMALYPMIQDVRQTLEAEILENGKIVE